MLEYRISRQRKFYSVFKKSCHVYLLLKTTIEIIDEIFNLTQNVSMRRDVFSDVYS